ncbi:MAG: hypothetical protein HYW52_05855 [Gemmatimonadetes bacterium]|nr:hypothetical protein [Gemmatimonadota bacterium]
MSGLSRSSARPRLGSAVIAAVLYAASAVVVPVVHARTEVLRSTSEVEAQHTQQCPRLHAEASCLVCSTFQFRTPLPRAFASAGPHRVCPTGGARQTLIISREGPSQHLVRAPPAR